VQLNYVPLAMQAGAKVYTKVCVHRIRYKRQHVTEVEGRFINPLTREKGPLLRVKAKVVVVCAGTLHTPVLLSRSGIPDPSGQRGRNLTMHPATKVYGLFDREVRGWEGIPQGYFCDALLDEGIKFEGVFLAPPYAASTILLTGREHRETMEKYPSIACFGFMVSDTTHGRVFSGPGGIPYPYYTINRRDLPKFKKGYRFLAEAFFAAGADRVMPGIYTLPVVTREQGVKAIDDLRLRNKDLDLQAFHPLGTCRMGADPREAVTDGWGRVYGLDNLFVADGSIFPSSLGVNPMVTIMAAATRVAENISKNHL
jgi:choline dehydrogenase-like flavoprotein